MKYGELRDRSGHVNNDIAKIFSVIYSFGLNVTRLWIFSVYTLETDI